MLTYQRNFIGVKIRERGNWFGGIEPEIVFPEGTLFSNDVHSQLISEIFPFSIVIVSDIHLNTSSYDVV